MVEIGRDPYLPQRQNPMQAQQQAEYVNFPSCRVRRTTNLDRASKVEQLAPWEAAVWDSEGTMWSAAAPDRITITRDGVYELEANVWANIAPVAVVYLRIYHYALATGLGTVVGRVQHATDAQLIQVVSKWPARKGDYFKLGVFLDNGTVLGTNMIGALGALAHEAPWFECTYLRPYLG